MPPPLLLLLLPLAASTLDFTLRGRILTYMIGPAVPFVDREGEGEGREGVRVRRRRVG